MQTYFGSFDENLWTVMGILAQIEGKTITNWANEKIEENINSITANYYHDDGNYERKKIRLDENLHQKIKTEAHLQECSMRDVMQIIIEKDYQKNSDKTLKELLEH